MRLGLRWTPTTPHWWCRPQPSRGGQRESRGVRRTRDLTAPRAERTWQWWPDDDSSDGSAGGAPGAAAADRVGPGSTGAHRGDDAHRRRRRGVDVLAHRTRLRVRPEMLASLAPYSREGWSFVAMRLTSPQPLDGSLDPVKLTFASDRLVYPMRMSAAARDAQRVRIYAVSDHRLNAPTPTRWPTHQPSAPTTRSRGGCATPPMPISAG